MASVLEYLEDANEVFNEIQIRVDDAEDNRYREFELTRTIQRWVRGFLERQNIKRIHAAAIQIQRQWRGYCGRKRYLLFLVEAVTEMNRKYYAMMATRIQKTYRGYYIRSTIFSYYALKNWIKLVVQKNHSLLHEMKNYHDAVENANMDLLEAESKDWVMFILFKLHHLLRTDNRPGIYSLLQTKELSILEHQLQSLKYTDFINILHKQRKAMTNKLKNAPPLEVPFYEGATHKRCVMFWHNRIRIKKPSVIAENKYVDKNTAILEAEKKKNWALQIQDEPMKILPMKYDDTYLVTGKGPYEVYNFTLRDTDPSKNISKHKFTTSFRPIELFEHLKTFDYGGPRTPFESKTDLFIRRHKERCYPSTKSKKK